MEETQENTKTLNESIIKIRVELQKSKLKKSGKNKHAGFSYYELSDFLPRLNELMLDEKVNDKFTIENDEVILTLMKGNEKQEYKMPFQRFETPVNRKIDNATGEVRNVKSMQDIQYLGALNTYYKRYLYINAFGITDGEIIDSMDNDEVPLEEMTLEVAKEFILDFGKHSGKKLTEIPDSYLNWLKDKGNDRVKKAIELLFPSPKSDEMTPYDFMSDADKLKSQPIDEGKKQMIIDSFTKEEILEKLKQYNRAKLSDLTLGEAMEILDEKDKKMEEVF